MVRDWSDDAFAGYLAAMIDGEGHIEVRGSTTRIRIANTVRPTLEAIIDRLGYGRVIEYARPASSNFKRLFCAEVSNVRDVGRVFSLCGRFIHMKRDQMEAALAVVRRVEAEVARIDSRNNAIRAAIATGEVQLHIAKRFGVSPQLVSRIKSGHTWGSVLRGHQARTLTSRTDQSFR